MDCYERLWRDNRSFFAYLRDRNISDKTKFAWYEKQRVETGIDYVDNYNVYTDNYIENLDDEDYKYLK